MLTNLLVQAQLELFVSLQASDFIMQGLTFWLILLMSNKYGYGKSGSSMYTSVVLNLHTFVQFIAVSLPSDRR